MEAFLELALRMTRVDEGLGVGGLDAVDRMLGCDVEDAVNKVLGGDVKEAVDGMLGAVIGDTEGPDDTFMEDEGSVVAAAFVLFA